MNDDLLLRFFEVFSYLLMGYLFGVIHVIILLRSRK